jgi:hypothetical protein
MTEFEPTIFVLGDRAGQGAWEMGHYRQHLRYVTLLASLTTPIVIADHPLMQFGDNNVERKIWLADHSAVHNLLRTFTNVTGIDLSVVDLDNEDEFQVWLDSHANEHDLLDQAFGL